MPRYRPNGQATSRKRTGSSPKGSSIGPEHGTIHYVLGSLCARMGQRDDARTRGWAGDDEELSAVRDALAEALGE